MNPATSLNAAEKDLILDMFKRGVKNYIIECGYYFNRANNVYTFVAFSINFPDVYLSPAHENYELYITNPGSHEQQYCINLDIEWVYEKMCAIQSFIRDESLDKKFQIQGENCTKILPKYEYNIDKVKKDTKDNKTKIEDFPRMVEKAIPGFVRSVYITCNKIEYDRKKYFADDLCHCSFNIKTGEFEILKPPTYNFVNAILSKEPNPINKGLAEIWEEFE